MGPGKPWNKGREKDREHSHPPPKKRQGRGTTGRNIGPGKPWNKGGEKDRALASPTLSGPKTDRKGGQAGEDHGAEAGEIQEKGGTCAKGRHGGVVVMKSGVLKGDGAENRYVPGRR